jgi:hypothetical protein
VLRAIKRVFTAAQEETRAVPAYERRQLQLAVAVLLHEALYVPNTQTMLARNRARG